MPSPEKSKIYSERKKSDNLIIPKIINEEFKNLDKTENFINRKSKNSF